LVCLLQEKQFLILSSDVDKVKSPCVSNVNPTSKISNIVLRDSLSNSTFLSLRQGHKKDMVLILDIMQVTFVTKPTVDLPTTGFNSQGGTQARTSNVTKHMLMNEINLNFFCRMIAGIKEAGL